MSYDVWPDGASTALVTVDADCPLHAAQRYGATQGLVAETPIVVCVRATGVDCEPQRFRVVVPAVSARRIG
jgi:hypothetical protein